MQKADEADQAELADGAALPRADAVYEAPGEGCATLTPHIRGRIRELARGQVLEVRTDDPAAREGVPAWCRLTGNELVATDIEGAGGTGGTGGTGGMLRFFIRKK